MDDQFGNLAHHLALEFAFGDAGDSEWGLLLAERSVNGSPQNVAAALTKARILHRQGKLNQASAELQRALSVTDDPPAIVHDLLAIVTQDLGRLEDAAFHRQQADQIRTRRMAF